MSDHLKKEITGVQRMPGQSPFRAVIAAQPRPQWNAFMCDDMGIVRDVMKNMRTLRLAKIVPIFSNWEFTQHGWQAKRDMSTAEWNKYQAWWNMLFELQRKPDDKDSVEWAILYIARETLKTMGGVPPPIAPEYFASKGMDPEHAMKIEDYVKTHINDLLPCTVAPGVDARSVTRPKFGRPE